MQDDCHFYAKNRRLKVCIVSLILVLLPVSQASARLLKLATVLPDGTVWMKAMRGAASEISERTEGRVKIKYYPGGVMGNDQSVLRKMRIGQLQGGAFTVGSLARIYPDVSIYQLPFIFNSQEEVDYVRARMDDTLLKGLARNGLISFGFAGGDFAYNMSAAAQYSLQDLREQKVWVPAGDLVGSAVMEAAGVAPISLPISDVLTGLQTGLINTVGASPVGAIAFQWYTKLPYVMDMPITYIYATLVIDKKAFKKISAQDQEIISEVMARVYKEMDTENRLDNQKAIAALKKQGVTFVQLSPELLADWRVVAKKAIAILAGKGAFTPAMLETLQKNLRQYHETTP